MQVVAINVGTPRELRGNNFKGRTGIFKEPAKGPVRVGPLGLEGDAVLNAKHHGGPDQAVYLYRAEDYAWWSEQLGREVLPGTFGDNLTVQGLPAPGLGIGTRLQLPELLLEVTAPRIPCNTLTERMDDPGFAKKFIRAERPGIYLRVIEAGTVRSGEPITLLPAPDDPLTTLDLYRDSYRRLDAARIREWLALPIDMRTRAAFEKKLIDRSSSRAAS